MPPEKGNFVVGGFLLIKEIFPLSTEGPLLINRIIAGYLGWKRACGKLVAGRALAGSLFIWSGKGASAEAIDPAISQVLV